MSILAFFNQYKFNVRSDPPPRSPKSDSIHRIDKSYLPKASRFSAIASWHVWEPAVVFAAGILSMVSWTLVAGPDINWDFLNYHLYLGLNAGGDRLATDYFPASSSSYLTPYAYWPIATMIAAKWPAMVVGSVMGAIHSLAVIATWYLAKQLFPDSTRKALALRVVSTVLGVVCPLVLTEVGTSFIDITSAIPVVVGIALLLRAIGSDSSRAHIFILSGFCLGLATALKLTNAPYALAAFLTMLMLWGLRSDVNWKMVLVFACGGAAGFVATYGAWGFQLWREFGNPFFPFFDSFFLAAQPPLPAGDLPPPSTALNPLEWLLNLRSGVHQRFLPVTVWDWLLRPLYMLDPVANVYVEVRSPDARFLALFCLAPFSIWRLRAQIRNSSLVALLLFFLFGWILWMGLFGNGRYLMPLALVVGPALVACAAAVWPRQSLVGLTATAVFVLVQSAGLWEGTNFRWTVPVWQEYWFSASLPHEVTDRPVTFTTFDTQSVSWLSAFAHPESRLVSSGASDPASETGSGLNRASRLLLGSKDIIAVFGFDAIDVKTGDPFPRSPVAMKITAIQHGFRVDFESCLAGKLDVPSAVKIHVAVDGEYVERKLVRGFFFCRAYFEPEIRQLFRFNPKHEAALDSVENACPRLYPPRAPTVCNATGCYRKYPTTDRAIGVDNEGQVTSINFGAAQNPVLGMADDLIRDPSKISCDAELGRFTPWSPGANIFSRGNAVGR